MQNRETGTSDPRAAGGGGSTATDRLLSAARDEVDARERLTAISRANDPCETPDHDEPEVGYFGGGPCRAGVPGDGDWCGPCLRYHASREAHRKAVRDRGEARRRTLKARREEIAAEKAAKS